MSQKSFPVEDIVVVGVQGNDGREDLVEFLDLNPDDVILNRFLRNSGGSRSPKALSSNPRAGKASHSCRRLFHVGDPGASQQFAADPFNPRTTEGHLGRGNSACSTRYTPSPPATAPDAETPFIKRRFCRNCHAFTFITTRNRTGLLPEPLGQLF